MIYIVFIIVLFLLIISLERFSLEHPAFVWIIIQILMYVGTFLITHIESSIEVEHFYLYSLFLFLFAFYSLFISTKKNIVHLFVIRKIDISIIKNMFIISVIITGIYFFLVGENLFLESIKSLISTKEILKNVAERRFRFYSGQKYYAPGFFYLFKNILLPVSFYFLLSFKLNNYINFSKKKIYFMTVLFIVLILGTGQRGAFVFSFVYAVLIFVEIFGKKRAKFYGKYLILFMFVFLFLGTFFLARNTGSTLNDLKKVDVISDAIFKRFIFINQKSGLECYKFIKTRESVQWGYDWIMSLEQILPGKSSYVTLDNKVFNYLYGTFRGTNPPTLVVSVYYNFGIVGILLFPIMLLLTMNFIYNKYYVAIKNYLDLYIYTIIYFPFATWVNGGIDYPIRNGLILLPLLLILLRRKKNNENLIYRSS